MEGDDHGEAYTAIVWGVGLSHENHEVAGAEAVAIAEGNVCGAVMRGTVALPGSEATSRTKGSRRNLGDLRLPAAAKAVPGRFGKARSRSRTGRSEESDGSIVPMKPRSRPRGAAAEGVEGRDPAGRRGRCRRMPRTQSRIKHVPRGIGPRVDTVWAAQAPNIDHA